MDADLNVVERSIVGALREAHDLHARGQEDAAKRILIDLAKVMVMYVRREDVEIHDVLTMPVIPTNNPEA